MGYEGGNVPKEMADCAMADILSTIIRRAAFGFCGVERKEKRTFVSLFRVFSVFFATFWTRIFPLSRERL